MLKKLTKKLVKAVFLTLLINSIQLLCIARYNEINGSMALLTFFFICVNTIHANEYDV